MKAEILHNNLLNSIKEAIPEGTNLANILMDTLFIGKEAAYRRLRGEVPFTLYETATISTKLGISIDNIVGSSLSENVLFVLNKTQNSDPLENDYKIFEKNVDELRLANKDPNSEVGISSNMIPFTFCMRTQELWKFRTFKWLYQHDNTTAPFQELVIPDKLRSICKSYVEEMLQMKNTYYIWDNMIFMNLVNDIKYYTKINLIGEDNMMLMKDELMYLIDKLEEISIRGHFKSGGKVQIYISDVNFEATYGYIEGQNLKLSLIRVFALNDIVSQDDRMFDGVKKWVQSLKRFSVLISESGEAQRIQFFRKQREIVNSLQPSKMFKMESSLKNVL